MYKVNILASLKNQKSIAQISIEDFIEIVRSSRTEYINKIKKYRSSSNKEIKMSLDVCCVNSYFEYSKDKNKTLTGLIFLDIDNVEASDIEKMKDKLISLPYIAAPYCSVSAKGVHAIGLYDKNCIKREQFNQVYSRFEELLREEGIEIDKACKNANRLTFISWDEHIRVKDIEDVLPIPFNYLNDNYYNNNLRTNKVIDAEKPKYNNVLCFDNMDRSQDVLVRFSENYKRLSVYIGGKLIKISEGERNNILSKLACELRVVHIGINEEDHIKALNKLNNLNKQLCKKKLPYNEVLKISKWAMAKSMSDLQSIDGVKKYSTNPNHVTDTKNRVRLARRARRMDDDGYILEIFDECLTLEENVGNMKDDIPKISLSKLKSILKRNNVTIVGNLEIERKMSNYDSSLSLRENECRIGLGKSTIQRFLKGDIARYRV